MSNIDYYLLQDHAARRRTTFVGAIIVVVLGAILQALGLSLIVTAIACFVAVGIIEVGRALTYKQARVKVKVKVKKQVI